MSELQGAWQCLHEEVITSPSFTGWERVLFHIDEAMGWESIRDLKQLQRSLLLVSSTISFTKAKISLPALLNAWMPQCTHG